MKYIAGVFSSGGYNYPSEPRTQVLELVKLLNPGSRILDIGAGFGNNCLPLLEQGHFVTATETNSEAIHSLRNLQSQFPNQLTVIQESAEQLKPTPMYDAIIAAMILQFLAPKAALKVIGTMKQATSPQGYHVVINYLTGQDLPPEYTFMLEGNELPSLYEGWKIISYEETQRNNTAGTKYYKSAKMIAQKQ